MQGDGRLSLIFVLSSQNAPVFRPGPITSPNVASDEEVESALSRLDIYALYVPLQSIAAR